MVELPNVNLTALTSYSRINAIGRRLTEYPPTDQALSDSQEYRRFRVTALRECIGKVLAAEPPVHSLVSARLKRLHSIRRKLLRHKEQGGSTRLSKMDDIIGLRVVCAHFNEALLFSDRLKVAGGKIKDYVKRPQDTGYRAVHHIVDIRQDLPTCPPQPKNFTFEVQIRTHYQNLWAIWSESCGESAKEGKASPEIHDHLLDLSGTICQWELNHPVSRQNTRPWYSNFNEHNVALIRRVGPRNVDISVDDSRFLDSVLADLFQWEDDNPQNSDALLLAGFSEHKTLLDALRVTHSSQFGRIKVPISIEANDFLHLRYDE